ncbi:MAG: ABC transporter substrate-binding protein [Acidimicrobiia bacterium]|nr:MAG: ABC transporter substrate-binding protein [Acidimicrobiia bacterium]
MRVVSLVPSATETLLALGVEPVGVTRFCDAAGRAVVGGTKNPDLAAVLALRPDLVVVNDEENRREDADALVAAGCALHDMSPRSVADVGPEVRALASRVGRPVPSPFGPGEWEEWMASVVCPHWWDAFVAVWRRPWMSLGPDTYGSSLLDLLGVHNVCSDSLVRYPEVTLEEVAARAPNVVLLPSEPYEFGERHVAEVRAVLGSVPVRLIDGRDLFWWGARTPAAARRLRAELSR